MKPKTKLEQFNFDLIDNLNLDNLDSEEWKKPEKTQNKF
jgi:predicted aldo/keto reductase-like oxidoreductase